MQTYNIFQLSTDFPDYLHKANEVCAKSTCKYCYLYGYCTANYTLERIDKAYELLFGRKNEIQEEYVLSFLEKEGVIHDRT